MKTVYTIAIILLVIGGLNWGLIGVFNWNLVEVIFGDMTTMARIVYTLVGVSAILVAVKSMSGGQE